MPLPTRVDLHARITEIISSMAKCPVSWAQHPALNLVRDPRHQQRFAQYLTGVVEAYLRKKTVIKSAKSGRSTEQRSTPRPLFRFAWSPSRSLRAYALF